MGDSLPADVPDTVTCRDWGRMESMVGMLDLIGLWMDLWGHRC